MQACSKKSKEIKPSLGDSQVISLYFSFAKVIIPLTNEVWGRGYIGITLPVRPSVCPAVCAKFVSIPYLSYGETLEVLTSHKGCL